MDADKARALLTEERERLRSTLEAVEANVAAQNESVAELANYDQHPADAASDTFERSKDQAIGDSVEISLAEVDAALQRIDEGTYGLCKVDGKPIPDERLEAVPATRYCVQHQPDGPA
ncbi:hypothetical protein BH24ACT14_BH24ACT14_05560 [soil metagenome]|jgi:RNA polymerase-binding transcription factor DksA